MRGFRGTVYCNWRTRLTAARNLLPSSTPRRTQGSAKRFLAQMEVVAALIYRGDLLLVCQRSENGSFPLKWEFPGGKVEKGEQHLTALRRELREELGIEVRAATEFLRHKHCYPNGAEVELLFYRVVDYSGAVVNRVFRQILWVEIQRLNELDFLDGDLPLIEKLTRRERLP